VLVLVLGVLPTRSAAQEPTAEAAETAAAKLVDAMARADWADMAARMHPGALKELRGLLEPMFSMSEMAGLRQQMLGVGTVDQMAAVPDARFFEGMMKLVMSQGPTMIEVLKTAKYSPVGVVMEGDTAHVVGRMVMEPEGIRITEMDVSSFLPYEGRWMALLTGDLSAMAAAMAAMAGQTGGGE
jgi:hypothetical protein